MGFHLVAFSSKDSERLEPLWGRVDSAELMGSKRREPRNGFRGAESQGIAHLVESRELNGATRETSGREGRLTKR